MPNTKVDIKRTTLFLGIGFGMITASFLVCIYYNVIIAWALFYLFASFQARLPWDLCDQWWNVESRCTVSAS